MEIKCFPQFKDLAQKYKLVKSIMCGKSKITYEGQNKTEIISQCGEFLVVNTFHSVIAMNI